MVARYIVEYQDEKMSAETLAKRFGVSPSCIRKRWQRDLRGEDLVAPSKKGRRAKPKTRDQVFAQAEEDRIRRAKQEAAARRANLRARAQDRADQVAREHAAAFARPLINATLLTRAERAAIRSRVKGVQRWNAGWFGESHDSREMRG